MFKDTGVSASIVEEVADVNSELSDESLTRASEMLASQFGTEIDGLMTPLPVEYGKKANDENFYRPLSGKKDGVQLFNTGRHHWVTGIFPKGESSTSSHSASKFRFSIPVLWCFQFNIIPE